MMKIPFLGGTWLIAVSSGPDSMALLDMCLKERIPCGVAHVNYHMRSEADEEEEYIKTFCEEKGIPCHILNEPFEYKGNFEASARNHRYDFFYKLIYEYNYNGVLIAHHQDDLIETYLMQKEKNIVPRTYGLAEYNDWKGILVYRPLLEYTKKELVDYCNMNHIKYYEDHTNEDTKYERNRIRKIVEGYTKEERESILHQIEEENKYRSMLFTKALHCIGNSKVKIEDYRLLDKDVRYTILRNMIERGNRHYSLKHIENIDDIVMKQSDFVIEVHDKYLVQGKGLMYVEDSLDPYEVVFHNKEEMVPYMHHWFTIVNGKPGVHAVTFLEDDFPITIRSVQEKDAIQMRFGTKKVHRFFIDRHIPLHLRKVWPVVVNAKQEIILVPGLGCDIHHYSINPDISVIE